MKTILRLCIGIIFVISGFAKALDTSGFADLIDAYGFGWVQNMAPIISSFEIILGICFILNIWTKQVALIIGILTLSFSLLFMYGIIFKNIRDCGCMGFIMDTPPIVSFLKNIFIIIASFFIWTHKHTNSPIHKVKLIVFYTFSCFAFGLSSFTFGIPLIDKNKINVGDHVNNIFLNGYNELKTSKISLVFVFSPNCYHCLNVTENIKSIKAIPEFKNTIAVTYQNSDTESYMRLMHPNFKVYRDATTELYDNVKEVPILILIIDGVVKEIFKADEIPNGAVLRNMLN